MPRRPVLTEKEVRARGHELHRTECMTGALGWYYLSFADDTGFLGGVCVQAWGPGTAVAIAHITGCNPGGEVRMNRFRDDYAPKAEHQYRLMSKEEMERTLGPTVKWE